MSAPAQVQLPRTIGPYRVVRLLGRGGSGVVYEVVDPVIPRHLALKVIRPDRLDRVSVERFWREAELLARIRHRNVVRVHQLGQSRQGYFLLMEQVEGRLLSELIAAGPVAPGEAVRLVRGLAQALAAIHQLGILHRDIKPTNVVVSPDGIPVLLDFGVAREADTETLTRTGSLLGTLAYMSPEQMRGVHHSQLDGRTDIYSLGVVLYELLTGRQPFEGCAVNVVAQVLANEPPSPASSNAAIGPELDALCRAAMAKRPEDRPRSAQALLKDLDARIDRSDRSGAEESSPLDDADDEPARGARGRAALLFTCALALAAIGSLSQARPHESRPAGREATRRLVLQPGPRTGKDTFVSGVGLYVNDNFGAMRGLQVGKRGGGQRGDMRAFLEFDISRLPPTHQVHKATLTLSIWKPLTGFESLTVRVQPVVPSPRRRTPWVEGTTSNDAGLNGMAWDGDHLDPARRGFRIRSRRPDLTQPDVDTRSDLGHGPNGLVAEGVVLRGQLGRVELDVTELVRAWLSGQLQNLGLRLAPYPGGAPYPDGIQCLELFSSDASHERVRPMLTIEHTESPPRAASSE